MNRYWFIRRLTAPAILLLLGVIALLHQADLVSWNLFVPLLLILIGALKLAERAALASEPPYPYPYQPGGPYPGGPYSGGQYPGPSGVNAGASQTPGAVGSAQDAGRDHEGDIR